MALIFAIESSCDETACALYDTAQGLLAEEVFSQWRRHAAYGGVVPELASRDHLRRLLPMAQSLLLRAGGGRRRVRPEVIAYTAGPGLAGALLVGAATAQALAVAWRLPLVAVNHLEGHLLSPLLLAAPPPFPYIALLVSGGHTQLWRVQAPGDYAMLGETLDDAAGEAFDKSAVLLGLGYPGGAKLEKLAARGNADALTLPSPAQNRYDFSFSGLKSAVRRAAGGAGVGAGGGANSRAVAGAADIAAAFQKTVGEGLARQLRHALTDFSLRQAAVVGGVAQNRALGAALRAAAADCGAECVIPPRQYCGDNAAMIAVAAAYGKQQAPGAFEIFPKQEKSLLSVSAGK